jgi:hypothetical protein
MPAQIATDATNAERTMVLRQKCFMQTSVLRRFKQTAGAVTARFARRFTARAATLAYHLIVLFDCNMLGVSRSRPVIRLLSTYARIQTSQDVARIAAVPFVRSTIRTTRPASSWTENS